MNVKLDMFEGPLDLLLHLIDTAEVDIYDVPIALITTQYLQVLSEAHVFELEVASEFLIMAATLLAIKSNMLLPSDPEKKEDMEEMVDPRQELVDRLLEYRLYKHLSGMLEEKEVERTRVYSRLPLDLTDFEGEKKAPKNVLTPDQLLNALTLLNRTKKHSEPIQNIEREDISMVDCMEEIERRLQQGTLLFSHLFQLESLTRERIITTFLALLELIKQQRITCWQSRLFEDIRVERCSLEVT